MEPDYKLITETFIRWINEGATLSPQENGSVTIKDGVLKGLHVYGAKAGFKFKTNQ